MQNREIVIRTGSPGESLNLGRLVGSLLNEPFAMGLTGDLGSGKTLFVKGLAQGLDVPEDFAVTSPTYTFINEYPGRLRLFHVDLYRISRPEELEDIGLYDSAAAEGVVAVEWAERLPEKALELDMTAFIETEKENSRTFRLVFHGPGFDNLVNRLEKSSAGKA